MEKSCINLHWITTQKFFKPVYVTVVKQSLFDCRVDDRSYDFTWVSTSYRDCSCEEKKTSGVLTVLLMLPLWVSGLVIFCIVLLLC